MNISSTGSSLIIPEKNIDQMVRALLDSGYWIKVEKLFDEKVLLLIRKEDK